MASYDLGISVFSVQDNNSRPIDPIGHFNSPSHNHDVPLPTPPRTNSRKSPDIPGSPASHAFDASSSYPPPLPTPSFHSSSDWIVCPTPPGPRDINPEHDDPSSSGLLTSPSQGLSSIVPVTPPFLVQRPSSLIDSFKRITRCVRYLSHLVVTPIWVLT